MIGPAKQEDNIGRSNVPLPVNSETRMIPVTGERTIAVKMAPIPTTANALGSAPMPGNHIKQITPKSKPLEDPRTSKDAKYRSTVTQIKHTMPFPHGIPREPWNSAEATNSVTEFPPG